MELNRCAYTILGILRTKKATDKVHGITISEISQFEKTSKYSTCLLYTSPSPRD